MRKYLIALLSVLVVPLALSAQLMSVDQLKKEMKGNKNLVVLGIEIKDEFIKDSQVVEYKLVRKDDNVPDAKLFEGVMQKLGVNSNSKIVIYESGKGYGSFHPAARLYWTFKYFGHKDVYILQGGFEEWKDMGGDVSKDKPKRVKKGNYKAGSPNSAIFASTDEVKAALGKKTIVDVRPFANYIGIDKPAVAKQKGHIDGAKSAPLDTYFKQGTHFHDKAALEKYFADLNIDLKGESIAYCNTGSFAAVGWYVMSEIFGKKVKLYDGSMKEWDGAVSSKLQN